MENVLTSGNYRRKKISNFLLNQVEIKIGRTRLLSYPYILILDPSNICNLQCPLCPSWQDTTSRPKGKMDIHLFRKIMAEAGPYIITVNLCNWGEPFLNPDLSEMIAVAKRYSIVTGLSTNLNYLPDDAAEQVMDAGIDIIVISLDGITQETYSKYRQGGELQKVLANIEKLNYFKRRSGNKTTLAWQFLVNKYNEKELEGAEALAVKMGMHFLPSAMRSSMGKELILPLYERVQEMKDWFPENRTYRKYPSDIRPETKTSQQTCKWLWNSMVINWDGSVAPCCGIFEEKWDFTNLSQKAATFHQAWNSPHYRLARKLVSAYLKKSDKLPKLIHNAEAEGLICRNCIKYGFLED
ncbi:MAG: SPASM domain-containing protein [Nitrospirae bacterium]|nr:SPASM domain-containing protein [Nitrospirota bacterium]